MGDFGGKTESVSFQAEEPKKLATDFFKKTKALPSIYYLPLTEVFDSFTLRKL